jgi:CRP/FNR family cyclic AMP-dependent transcriptional regulator
MSFMHSNNATWQKNLTALPLATYRAGETVLSATSTTGRLLILKEGAVTVVKEGVEIAKVTEPGAVFGELSTLLGQPHTADVRALEDSQFHVASTAASLMQDPVALLYVATALSRRVDSANRALVELKHQVQAGQPSSNPPQDKQEESSDRWRPPSPARHLALARSEVQRSIEYPCSPHLFLRMSTVWPPHSSGLV